jgi:hypothetical protein
METLCDLIGHLSVFRVISWIVRLSLSKQPSTKKTRNHRNHTNNESSSSICWIEFAGAA